MNNGAWHRYSQVAVEPVAHSRHRVDLMVTLVPAVALAGIDHEFGVHALRGQRVVELLALRQRHAQVELAVHHQGGSLHPAHMHHR